MKLPKMLKYSMSIRRDLLLVAAISIVWLFLYRSVFIKYHEIFYGAHIIGLVMEVVAAGYVANFVFYIFSSHLIDEFSKENDFRQFVVYSNRIIYEYGELIGYVFGDGKVELKKINKDEFINNLSKITAQPKLVSLRVNSKMRPVGLTPLMALFNYKREIQKVLNQMLSTGLKIDSEIKIALLQILNSSLFAYLDDMSGFRLLPGMDISKMNIFANELWELHEIHIVYDDVIRRYANYYEIGNGT